MDPVSMMMAGAAGMQAVGDILGGNMADKVGTRNAALLDERARMTQEAASVREGLLRQRMREGISATSTTMLANGIDPGSGSALFAVAQQARDAEVDALMERYQGGLEARDLRIQAQMVKFEGKAAKKQSRLTAMSRLAAAGGNYLSGGGFGSRGPGFSGQQAPAPVSDRSFKSGPR